MNVQSVFDEWRQKVLAYDREAEALRSGHGPNRQHEDGHVENEDGHGHGGGHEDGHGHGGGHGDGHGGHGGFSYVNRPYDPFRANDPVVNSLFGLLGSDATVLDVGGGAGRFALPLATRARHVTVVEPSADAVEMLRERAEEAGLSNITVISDPWEDADAPKVDMVLCSLVLHHVTEAAKFIAKMEEHAMDRVVVVEMMKPPSEVEMPFYERVYGSAPTQMPGLPEVLQLLWAIDINPDVTMLPPETIAVGRERDEIVGQFRRRLAVEESTPADSRLLAAMDELLEETPRGFTVKGLAPRRTGIITWLAAQ